MTTTSTVRDPIAAHLTRITTASAHCRYCLAGGPHAQHVPTLLPAPVPARTRVARIVRRFGRWG